MADWLPRVACICLTYGRTERLQEAIAFFLAQDYRGEKELIVVNDLAEQELILDHRDAGSSTSGRGFRPSGESATSRLRSRRERSLLPGR